VPYWFSVAMVMAVIVCIALLQYAVHGGGLLYQYHHVKEAKHADVAPGRWQLIAMVTVVPRLFKDQWLQAPPNVMWFVVLILQYYVLFPVLRSLLHAAGPARFLAVALATTLLAKLLLITFVGGIDHDPAGYLNHCLAPFRLFEFALGMDARIWSCAPS
jgi:hypothetical protein